MLEKSSHKSPTEMENFLYLFAALIVQHRQIRERITVVTSSVIWYSSKATSYSTRHTRAPTLYNESNERLHFFVLERHSLCFSRVCCVVWKLISSFVSSDDEISSCFVLMFFLAVLWTQPHRDGSVRWEEKVSINQIIRVKSRGKTTWYSSEIVESWYCDFITHREEKNEQQQSSVVVVSRVRSKVITSHPLPS